MSTCSVCKYFTPDRADFPGSEGICRRYPPQVTVVIIPERSALGGPPQLHPQPVASYSITGGDNWCGEYLAALAAL